MKQKTKGNYIYPSKFAKLMAGISPRTQYEASMMSMTFILLGLIASMIYIVFFMEVSLVMKIGITVNSLAGMVFLFSFLTTTFQQYQTYLVAVDLMDEDTDKINNMEKEVKKDG